MSVVPGSGAGKRFEEAALWTVRLSENPAMRDEAAFLAWLAADPRNRETFDDLTATLQSVESHAGAPEIVRLRSDGLAAARRSHQALRVRAFFASRLGMVASVAVLALLLATAGVWWSFHAGAVETGIGERRVVALADGSRLSLDAATAVRVDYTADRRRVVLKRGRAKFDVNRDPLRPFSVEAGGKVVVAVGTSFSVELVESEVRVVLYEGRVEVLKGAATELIEPARASKPANTVLEPGQELIASAFEPRTPARIGSIDPRRSLAWESGELAFADEPLALAVERVNRYSSRQVTIGDPAAGEVRISGIFHAGDMEAFVDGVTALFPIRAERTDDGAMLLFDATAKN